MYWSTSAWSCKARASATFCMTGTPASRAASTMRAATAPCPMASTRGKGVSPAA
ncbi:Uncharacterised protein [Bordetella pertussis]|nr:Uncharacterised protein [Bordetella pertussis]